MWRHARFPWWGSPAWTFLVNGAPVIVYGTVPALPRSTELAIWRGPSPPEYYPSDTKRMRRRAFRSTEETAVLVSGVGLLGMRSRSGVRGAQELRPLRLNEREVRGVPSFARPFPGIACRWERACVWLGVSTGRPMFRKSPLRGALFETVLGPVSCLLGGAGIAQSALRSTSFG